MPDPEIHVICTEQKRLTEMETTLKFFRQDILPRHEKKLNKIQATLENGLTGKVDRLADKLSYAIEDLRRLSERPRNDDSGEPIERRTEPPPPPPKKKFWKDWTPATKAMVIFFTILNFPLLYAWADSIATNFIDIVKSLAGLK